MSKPPPLTLAFTKYVQQQQDFREKKMTKCRDYLTNFINLNYNDIFTHIQTYGTEPYKIDKIKDYCDLSISFDINQRIHPNLHLNVLSNPWEMRYTEKPESTHRNNY